MKLCFSRLVCWLFYSSVSMNFSQMNIYETVEGIGLETRNNWIFGDDPDQVLSQLHNYKWSAFVEVCTTLSEFFLVTE